MKGSISAWAEEPVGERDRHSGCRVDLRVGGGAQAGSFSGLSAPGRSPRGRRSHHGRSGLTRARGSISAWAEEPYPISLWRGESRVDLRVGGGAFSRSLPLIRRCGRSPRGRRSRSHGHRGPSRRGSISAWAEEPPNRLGLSRRRRVDLRVGGGAAETDFDTELARGRSPRGRRSRFHDDITARRRGSISAWAEEPYWPPVDVVPATVDLRVGGGALRDAVERDGHRGRSPRGRRSQQVHDDDARWVGSISAWAEEPLGNATDHGVQRVDLRVGGGAPTPK